MSQLYCSSENKCPNKPSSAFFNAFGLKDKSNNDSFCQEKAKARQKKAIANKSEPKFSIQTSNRCLKSINNSGQNSSHSNQSKFQEKVKTKQKQNASRKFVHSEIGTQSNRSRSQDFLQKQAEFQIHKKILKQSIKVSNEKILKQSQSEILMLRQKLSDIFIRYKKRQQQIDRMKKQLKGASLNNLQKENIKLRQEVCRVEKMVKIVLLDRERCHTKTAKSESEE